MNTALSLNETDRLKNKLLDELSFALRHTSQKDILSWGTSAAARVPKVGIRRIKNLGKLALNLGAACGSEVTKATSAWKEKRFNTHITSRGKAGIISISSAAVSLFKAMFAISRSFRHDPRKNALGVFSCALGFYIGSGGMDGNGGIPDTDFTLFGIGQHRSIFTHSIIAGVIVECSILALADLADIVCNKVPKETRSVFWDQLVMHKDQFAEQLMVGASYGIAYHLAVDATIQPASYKDLPISIPIEGHQVIFGANALAEARDGFEKNRS